MLTYIFNVQIFLDLLILRGWVGTGKRGIVHWHSEQSIYHLSSGPVVLVVVSLVGVEGIGDLAVVDNTVSPSLTSWLLVFLIGPTTSSDRVSKLDQLAPLTRLVNVNLHSCTPLAPHHLAKCSQCLHPDFA